LTQVLVLDAHEIIYGVRALPFYNLDKANFILSIGADFLGDWKHQVSGLLV
jgi:molybdopterin-containing oxidoreductase family iron-sulfur binding subunit